MPRADFPGVLACAGRVLRAHSCVEPHRSELPRSLSSALTGVCSASESPGRSLGAVKCGRHVGFSPRVPTGLGGLQPGNLARGATLQPGSGRGRASGELPSRPVCCVFNVWLLLKPLHPQGVGSGAQSRRATAHQPGLAQLLQSPRPHAACGTHQGWVASRQTLAGAAWLRARPVLTGVCSSRRLEQNLALAGGPRGRRRLVKRRGAGELV